MVLLITCVKAFSSQLDIRLVELAALRPLRKDDSNTCRAFADKAY